MPLDPQAVAFLEQFARQKNNSVVALPIDLTRRAAILGTRPSPHSLELANVENQLVARPDGTSLFVRIYTPRGQGPFGACLYFHGGGWVLNSVDTHDDLVRRLAVAADCIFVSVEYRLAPEHKYPAAVEDAYTALVDVCDNAASMNIDPARIAVSGDSAGGNLAAAVCLMTKDRGGPPIAFQALIYPITDCDFDRPSYLRNHDGYFLTRREMQWFWNHYVSTVEQMREPYASPLLAPSLSGLPPALILTAEYDPLCDEGEAYAAALERAGVPVTLRRYDGMIHSFVRRVDQFDAAHAAIQEIGRHVHAAIGHS